MTKISKKHVQVLVVEDHHFILNTIGELLRSVGYEDVDKTMSAEDAMLNISANFYNVIIADVEMPGMNGLKFLKMIRTGKTSARKDTPFIIMTNHSNIKVLSTAIALDVNGFLAKPIELKSLQEKIDKAVETRIKLRQQIAYECIPTNLENFDIVSSFVKKETGISNDIILDLSIKELNPGMILAEDLYMNNGKVLLPKGFSLTQNSIQRLVELGESIDGANIKIQIR